MSAQQPVLTPPGAGKIATFPGGSTTELKIDSAATDGDYGAIVYTVAAGEEPPLHTHTREDEIVYVLDGELVAIVGDARIDVGPGACAALPRGVPHTIEVKGSQAKLLLGFVPGGLEHFFVPEAGIEPDPADFGLEMHASSTAA